MPTTETGRRLTKPYWNGGAALSVELADAIEAEAREQGAREERERLRELVKLQPLVASTGTSLPGEMRSRILALLADPEDVSS